MSKSLVEKLQKFLSRKERERILKREKLHKILNKMRKKQKALEEELLDCRDDEVALALRKKIRLLKEQRRKGLTVLAELRRNAGESDDKTHQHR